MLVDLLGLPTGESVKIVKSFFFKLQGASFTSYEAIMDARNIDTS